jgi:SNF2 family DNA or RNA helicase
MLGVTTEYKYFIKNSYLHLDTMNLKKWSGDDSDFYGTDTTPNIELIGDNSLTKMLYARQLCGQYHKEKLQALRDLVESTEDRIIIFYNFTEELNRMKNHLDELQRPYSVLNGSTKDLNAYENCDDSITFIQYQAGAMGGNFQKANKIIYYTLPLGKGSCDLWEQSKKRIHRIGQSKPCFYYYLLVKGSIEEQNLHSLKVGKDYTDELFKKS